jgi:hypothetical protein
MEHIPDEVFEHFLWLLVKYDCPYALLLIAERAQAAGVPAKEWLREIVEKELGKELRLRKDNCRKSWKVDTP